MKKEKWVNDVKLFACILVTLGHFFQSMVNSGILIDTLTYRWFNKTIYYFHVPLFFLCSGYLYQKKTGTGNWFKKIARKGLSLGIPYVVFSTATWLLKEVFSGSVNIKNTGLLRTLLLEPASPYWFLYTLFFVFLITPRFANGKVAMLGITCAVLLKVLRISGLVETGWYPVDSVMDNSVWFVLGMLLPFVAVKERWSRIKMLKIAVVSAGMFIALSLWISLENIRGVLIAPVMGILGCATVVLVLRNWNMGMKLHKFSESLAKYTMPIFLMHTIFAAGVRAVLVKLGIEEPIIHVIIGITASFLGPIATVLIMERLKLDFIIYPGKYVNRAKLKES